MSAKFHSCALALLVLSGLLQQLAAIRASSDEELHLAASSHQTPETCTETLQTVFSTVTYRDLYSPLLDGAYRIRNRFSGEYLTANREGFAATTLYHVYSSGMSDWKLQRVKNAGTPVYTLQNRKTNHFLVADGMGVKAMKKKKVDASGQWSFALASDGVHRIIGLPSTGNLALASLPSDMLKLGERLDTEDALESLLRGEWLLEWMPSWWRLPQSDTWGYESQWKVAANIPLFPGTEYTWLDFCSEEGLKTKCTEFYAEARSSLVATATISETTRRYVTQNTLSGSCDFHWGLLRFMFKESAQALSEMRTVAGKECAAKTIKQVASDLETAIMAECYDECLTSIRQVIASKPCEKPENATALFNEILSHGTCEVSGSALEALTEFAAGEKCLKFNPPSPLWTAELYSTTSLTVADGNPVCAIPGGKESSRDSADLAMNRANGVCVSGTTCQCPQGLLKERESTLALQTDSGLFVTGGSSAEAIFQSTLKSAVRKVALQTIILGSSLGAAILAVPFGITFLPKQIWSWGNLLVEGFKWRCTQTSGCWPTEPELKKTDGRNKVCRFPDATKQGGSLVWFMPPPQVKVTTKKWYEVGRRCELAACTKREILTEKIGFFGQHIFNCQRLPYESMAATVQEAYLAKLRETLPEEYVTEI